MVEDRLGTALGELGRILVATYQLPAALARLCAQLAGMLPVTGCWAVILDELDGRLQVAAATDPVARRVQDLQVELNEGPCLLAARTGERVLLADLTAPAAIERFPHFVPHALAAGVAAVYSFPLSAAGRQVGSLGLCDEVPASLDKVDLELAQLLVDLTTTSIVGAHHYQQVAGLVTAVGRRFVDTSVLEQAKGRLSVQLGVAPDIALVILRRWASSMGMSLATVAERVAAGELRLPPGAGSAARPDSRTAR